MAIEDEPSDQTIPPLPRFRDAGTMRALAHPSRMALWELLIVHGPMTATQAAEHVDDSPSNCSFHLRQLARYGLVEEAGDVASAGRSRPWRVTQVGYTTTRDADDVDPAADIAAEALAEVAVNRSVERHRQWQRRHHTVAEPWRDISRTSQTVWWVTADEATALKAEIDALVFRFHDRLKDRDTHPAGARPIEFLALMHPFDDSIDQPDDDT
jgi:hypothetical protein